MMGRKSMSLKMTKQEISVLFDELFPQIKGEFTIQELGENTVTMRMNIGDRHLRPGGTVSGPSMFALADVTVYAMILGMIGPLAMSVTTSCSLDFMRKPVAHADLIAKGQLLKLGRALAVGDVLLYSEGLDKPVARATMTYSIPPEA
ncbi:MAG: hypothetical protein ACI92Z_002433 [Paracoccaceae bacterium]|jgi:uncharacterized protein (TIGR00369 family)